MMLNLCVFMSLYDTVFVLEQNVSLQASLIFEVITSVRKRRDCRVQLQQYTLLGREGVIMPLVSGETSEQQICVMLTFAGSAGLRCKS